MDEQNRNQEALEALQQVRESLDRVEQVLKEGKVS